MIVILFSITSFGQTQIKMSQNQARYNGGEVALFKYLSNDIITKANKPQLGDTILKQAIAVLTISSTGKVEKANISVSSGSKNIDKIFLEGIFNMPNWIPANVNGKNVESNFTLPFKFKQK